MAADRAGRRFGTVRVRTTVAAATIVGIALLIGAVALVAVLRRNLIDNIDTAARLRARDVAAVIADGQRPDDLNVDNDEASLVQVLDARGAVVASSENISGEPAITRLDPGSSRTIHGLPIDDGAYRVVAEPARAGRSHFTVLVARETESVDHTITEVTSLLAAGLPMLVLLVAATTWVVAGRALRPVEAIRVEVAAITTSELGRRVPEPDGHDEVARLARTMNSMLERLEAARDRQRRFVSDAGHELRSPIATIRHELETALASPAAVDVSDLARDLLAEDLRMQTLVEDLLVLARSDEGTIGLNPQVVDLDDILLAEAGRLRSRGLVRVDAGGISAGRVRGDPAHLARMVRNLVDNAERHATRHVRLALGQDDRTVTIEVADDGDGIAPVDRERIFQRFTRLDDSRARATGGYGLGLAIVREVVAAHGGSVTVEDRASGGARFVVRLPAHPT